MAIETGASTTDDALGDRPDRGRRAEQEHADTARGSAGGTARDLSGAEIGPVDVYRDGDGS